MNLENSKGSNSKNSISQTANSDQKLDSQDPSMSSVSLPKKEENHKNGGSLKGKADILQRIRSDRSNTNKQASLDWMEQRKTIIGGSEIYGFLNSKDIQKFIRKKNSNSSYQNIFMMWGKIFEEVAKEIIIAKERLVREFVYDYGSLETTHRMIRFSPDLIGIRKTEDQQFKIILYEIKCPYKTSCRFNLTKKQYLYQIKTGVEFLEFVDYGFLWCFDFKVQSMRDLMVNTFEWCGFLIFYVDDPGTYVHELACLDLETRLDRTIAEFRNFLDQQIKMEIVILKKPLEERESEIRNLLTWFNKGKIKSILPWSLFDEDRMKIDKKKYLTNKELEKLDLFEKEMKSSGGKN